MNKICYIVAASDADGMCIDRCDGDLIIAADAGLTHLNKINICPDLAVGDFDSYGSTPRLDNLVVLPFEKDDTDTAVALAEGYEMGYRSFVIYGGLGRRLDHTLANIQTCFYYAKKGCVLCLWGNGESVCVFDSRSMSFGNKENGTISVFTDSVAQGVCIKGVKYSVSDYKMTNTFPIGVSNEFIGENAVVSSNKGTLAVILYESAKECAGRIRNV